MNVFAINLTYSHMGMRKRFEEEEKRNKRNWIDDLLICRSPFPQGFRCLGWEQSFSLKSIANQLRLNIEFESMLQSQGGAQNFEIKHLEYDRWGHFIDHSYILNRVLYHFASFIVLILHAKRFAIHNKRHKCFAAITNVLLDVLLLFYFCIAHCVYTSKWMSYQFSSRPMSFSSHCVLPDDNIWRWRQRQQTKRTKVSIRPSEFQIQRKSNECVWFFICFGCHIYICFARNQIKFIQTLDFIIIDVRSLAAAQKLNDKNRSTQ